MTWEEKKYTLQKRKLMQTTEQNQSDTTSEIKKKSLNAKCCGIYGLKNKTNGKWYVGQSIYSIKSRWKEYHRPDRCKGQTKLYKALKKYGIDNFDKIVLEECLPDRQILDSREDYWIRNYDSVENGYNCRYGGANGKMSKESIQKIKNWNNNPVNKKQQSIHSKAHIDQFGHPWANRSHTDESKAQMASHDRSGKKSPSFGKIWINNGIESKKIPKNSSMPNGFMRGRLMGTIVVNNGIERKFIKKDSPLPTGFVYGNLYKRKSRLCK